MYIILGNFIDEAIKKERKLPFLNTAGNNRMLRIAQALKSLGKDVCIISPATSLKMKWSGKIFHRSYLTNNEGINIFYCTCIGIPFLSSIFELIIFPFTVLKYAKNKKIEGSIFYCYYSSNVITAILLRLFFKIPIIEDLEDICSIRLVDWTPKSNINPIHQLSGWFLMKLMIIFSTGFIIPTRRFIKHLPANKNSLVIDGCMKVVKKSNFNDENPNQISILFSGKLDEENGLFVLLDSIIKLDKSYNGNSQIAFNICGRCSDEQEIKKVQLFSTKIKLTYHGFISNQEYFNLLNKCQVGIVLQDPKGRFSNGKTPSKGYEYMGFGKVLIISDIGDFSTLPENTRIILDPFNAENLFGIITSLNQDTIKYISNNALEYARLNWTLSTIGEKIEQKLFNK